MSQKEWKTAALLRFQNDDRHGLDGRMGDRKRDIPDSQAIRELGRDAVELQRRTPRRQIRYLEILPADAAPPACSDGLHPRFLGGESCGIAFVAIRLALDVRDFGGRINALDEAAPVTFDGRANAVHLGEIHARSDDHNSAPVEVMVRRPCFTPLVLIKASAIFFTAAAFPFTTSTSRQLS